MPLKDPKKNKFIFVFPEFSPMRMKYKDIFDMKAFYDSLKEWMWDHGWKSDESDLNKEQWESYYFEKVDQGGAKELWIRWRLAKQAPDAPMLKYYLDLDFHCLGLKGTEVVKDGMKVKAHKGECELHIRAFIEPLYFKQFKEHSLLKNVIGIFNKRIYRKTIESRKKALYQECYILNNFIKQWFKLKRYLPYEETRNFYPSQAWPSHLKEG